MTGLYLATPPPPLPHAAADTLFPRVLLAIDFSSASLGAARWATTHVASRGEAVLMHVVPSDAEPTGVFDFSAEVLGNRHGVCSQRIGLSDKSCTPGSRSH